MYSTSFLGSRDCVETDRVVLSMVDLSRGAWLGKISEGPLGGPMMCRSEEEYGCNFDGVETDSELIRNLEGALKKTGEVESACKEVASPIFATRYGDSGWS